MWKFPRILKFGWARSYGFQRTLFKVLLVTFCVFEVLGLYLLISAGTIVSLASAMTYILGLCTVFGIFAFFLDLLPMICIKEQQERILRQRDSLIHFQEAPAQRTSLLYNSPDASFALYRLKRQKNDQTFYCHQYPELDNPFSAFERLLHVLISYPRLTSFSLKDLKAVDYSCYAVQVGERSSESFFERLKSGDLFTELFSQSLPTLSYSQIPKTSTEKLFSESKMIPARIELLFQKESNTSDTYVVFDILQVGADRLLTMSPESPDYQKLYLEYFYDVYSEALTDIRTLVGTLNREVNRFQKGSK